MKRLLPLLPLLFLPVASALYGQNQVQKNVILLIVDDLSADPGTRPTLQMPHVDRLRSKGMSFQSAHAASPLCNPSRTAAFTGIAPWQSKIYTNDGKFREDETYKNAVTLPQFFKNQGYVSIGTGKIFHRSTGNGCDPVSWTRNLTQVDVLYETSENTAVPVPGTGGSLPAYVEQVPLAWGQLDKSSSQMDDWANLQPALSFLKGQSPGDSAFFLACGIVRPHLPHFYPREFAGYYADIQLPSYLEPGSDKADTWDTPSKGNQALDSLLALPDGAQQWKQAVQSYFRAAAFADSCVGTLLDAIESLPEPVRKNTIVVLMGDHGYHFGQKSSWAKVGNGWNQLPWEQTTHTPLVIYDPAQTASQGKSYTLPVSLQDLYPTLLELCGYTPAQFPDNDPQSPKTLWGNSLAPILKNPEGQHDSYALSTLSAGVVSLRTRDWRYIQMPGKRLRELYYHGSDPAVAAPDPNEHYNLLHPGRRKPRYRKIAAEMDALAAEIMKGQK